MPGGRNSGAVYNLYKVLFFFFLWLFRTGFYCNFLYSLGEVQEKEATQERSSQNGEIRSMYHGQHNDYNENGKPG